MVAFDLPGLNGQTMKKFSPAADNNKGPILEVLRQVLLGDERVLEIGSGSGQHAIFFGESLPQVIWQPTDTGVAMDELAANIRALAPKNVRTPVSLDLARPDWPLDAPDVVYAANVLHIVSPALGESLIRGAGSTLQVGGRLLLYGPFKYGGEFTSPSNKEFDLWLRARSQSSGVRDVEWVTDLAAASDLSLAGDQDMPANNRLLVFKRR